MIELQVTEFHIPATLSKHIFKLEAQVNLEFDAFILLLNFMKGKMKGVLITKEICNDKEHRTLLLKSTITTVKISVKDYSH